MCAAAAGRGTHGGGTSVRFACNILYTLAALLGAAPNLIPLPSRMQSKILRMVAGAMLAAGLFGGCARSSNSYTSEGYVLSHRFEYGAATKAFDEALKADPDNAQAYYGRGIVRMCTGQYDAAIADFSSAIRLDPQWFDYKNRAASFYETGDYPRDLADLNEAIALEPKDPVLSLIRAGLYARSGQVQTAKADLAKAAIKAGTSPSPMYLKGLAWILATTPSEQIRNGPDAVRFATEACKMTEWREPEFLATLAAAYAANGRFDDAVKWQKKAWELAQVNESERLNALRGMKQGVALYEKHQPYRETPIVISSR
jgi:tetratricopeptide (TPR) repeat protein